ncbi:hypothetical protein OH76DRAFT_1039342 [Lentinus brumalis]|uniref:Uncharacterized protein n=1 Tax=Lentinus brumalis TaxID=2498619 RepID=A0A371CWW9_9APHY|nr:hypothetical protein OH76DRAFT_1039342 [Polyporus brumalis]
MHVSASGRSSLHPQPNFSVLRSAVFKGTYEPHSRHSGSSWAIATCADRPPARHEIRSFRPCTHLSPGSPVNRLPNELLMQVIQHALRESEPCPPMALHVSETAGSPSPVTGDGASHSYFPFSNNEPTGMIPSGCKSLRFALH